MPKIRCYCLFGIFLLCLLFPVLSSGADDLPVLKRTDQFFGRIMSGTQDKILLAMPDLVVANFGLDRSVEVGSVFNVYEQNRNVPKDKKGRYLFTKVAEVTLIKTFDEKSVAKVTRNFKEINLDSGIYYLDPLALAVAPQPKPVEVPAEVPATPPVVAAPPAVQPPVREETMKPEVAFEQELVYFAYDDAGLTETAMDVIRKKALYLTDHPEQKVLVEGHCDERGSVEYNLALGQRRAQSVRDFLIVLGIEAGRIRTISYGKERPVDPGHNEEAWARNRRAQFVLQ